MKMKMKISSVISITIPKSERDIQTTMTELGEVVKPFVRANPDSALTITYLTKTVVNNGIQYHDVFTRHYSGIGSNNPRKLFPNCEINVLNWDKGMPAIEALKNLLNQSKFKVRPS